MKEERKEKVAKEKGEEKAICEMSEEEFHSLIDREFERAVKIRELARKCEKIRREIKRSLKDLEKRGQIEFYDPKKRRPSYIA